MKKIFISGVVMVVIGLGVFLYATRPAAAPSGVPNLQQTATSTNSTHSTSTQTTATSTNTIKVNGGTYIIDPSASIVEFRIAEILRGHPFTPVGTSSNITGDVTISGQNIIIGTIAVNARSFKTDNSRRDSTIVRFILKAEDPANEFIYFNPKTITGLSTSTSVSSGKNVIFNVSGDLRISSTTKPATFIVTMKMNGDVVTGTAATTIKRSDYNLIIPRLSFVADVDDTFTVIAKVTARKQ